MSKATKKLLSALKQVNKKKTQGYDTTATVKRIEGKTAWVHIPGGVAETPVKMTINATEGDTVQVRVSGGKAWITGNATKPPTDDTMAIDARGRATRAQLDADAARIKALAAQMEAAEAQKTADQNAVDMANAVVAISQDIEDLQSQIDGNITSWFYTVDPTMSTPPVSDWTVDQYAAHLGDLYYNTDSGYVWRFVYQNNAYQWVRVQDSDVTRALEAAAAAQDTADAKRRVFISQPVPPYDAGDLWCVGSSGDILTCTTPKVEGQLYDAGDWTKLNKYTDDTRADQAYERAGAALNSANGKNKIYHQSSQPSEGTYIAGDTWFDTDDGYKMYTYNGSSWVAEQFGNAAIADLAITNAKIADATIRSAKIQALDVGKLTGGYIDASHINAAAFNVGSFVNDGTYTSGKIVSVTTGTRSTTYATAAGYLGTANDAWSNVTAFSGSAGDMVMIPFIITDRDNASASMLVRVRSYSGTTLHGDNLALIMDAAASKYVTVISGYSGVTVHAAGDTSNFANMNSNGFYIYKGGTQNAAFEANQAKLGSNKAILKYSEDGSAFGIQDSHRVVLAKATDESGVRNDATLSSREISTFSSSVPMAFVNASHKASGSTKSAQVGLYAWGGSGIVPSYVILQEGNSSSGSILTGDAPRGLYIGVPKLVLDATTLTINNVDWTSLKTDYDATAALVDDIDEYVGLLANCEPAADTKFVREKYTFTMTIPANSYTADTEIEKTKSGYYPIAIAGYDTGGPNAYFAHLQITTAAIGSVKVKYRARNIMSGTQFSNTATIEVLWVKVS